MKKPETERLGLIYGIYHKAENLIDKKGIGNTDVALSTYELKLFLKKMKQKELEYARHRMWF